MKVVLLGAPGCGKGTQAGFIAEKYNIPHISTGEIFRANIQKGTPLGIEVKSVMDSGNLCPDQLTIELVRDRLKSQDCANGYLLDGFPRNLVQAKALDTFEAPDVVLELEVDFKKLEARITGRRSCAECKGTFHISSIGDTKVCPNCGAELYVRKDDTPETVRERLTVYTNKTQPLIEYYQQQGKLKKVDGNLAIDDVFKEIVKVLS